jgi:uncharacterized protein (TIGR03067 family)
MRVIALLAVGVFAGTLIAADDKKDDKKKDEEAILGKWQLQKMDSGDPKDPPLPAEALAKMTLTFKKDGKVANTDFQGKEHDGEYKLDTAAKPKTIDLGKDKDFSLGVYELDGDTLKVCLLYGGKTRPTEFKADGKGTVVTIFKRVTDEKKDDPIRKRLDEAKAAYDKSMKEYADGVAKWFEAEDYAARKSRTEVAEKVKQVAAEKKLFDENGGLPRRAVALWEKVTKANDTLIVAYKAASDGYSRQKKDAEAAVVEKEYQGFLKRASIYVSPKDLLGKWSGRVGPTFRTEWTFAADGTVTSSNGEAKGSWRVDGKGDAETVLIEWPIARAWDRLTLPLDPNKSTGTSSAGTDWKVEAVKVKGK